MINIIESYWQRINNIEEKIEYLARKGINYSFEMQKRKVLLRNVKQIQASSPDKSKDEVGKNE
jgi:hypothetical protein